MKQNDLDLYQQFVKTIFKMRYKGSILGFLWVLLKPFFMFLVLFVIFSSTSRASGGLTSQQYAVYLLSGLVVYTFFNEGFIWGMNSILERASLIVKVNFKREISVISGLTMALINFSINFLIIIVVATILDIHLSFVSISYTLLVIATIFIILYGLSFFFSIWLVHVRDLTHIMELVFQLLFYCSAVFFPVTMIPEKYRFVVEYNPLAVYIDSVRNVLLYQQVTHLPVICVSLLLGILLVLVGRLYFKKNILRIAEYF